MARKKVKQADNLFERAIKAVSPQWALSRHRARVTMAMTGGYIGGSRSRPALQNFNPGAGDADGDISFDLPTLRARSRDLARNAPVATGAINTVVTNVIGTGLSMQPRINSKLLGLSEEAASAWQEKTQSEYEMWYGSVDCDVTRTQTGYGLQDLAFRSMLESGDVFSYIVKAEYNKVYPFALQLIEADRVANPSNQRNTESMVDGVILSTAGAPVKYKVCKTHPGSLRTRSLEYIDVPAFTAEGRRVMLHLFERRRPGQHRGVPYLSAIIEPLKQLDRYTEAELSAAVTNAVHAMFVKMDPQAFNDLFDDDGRNGYMQAAASWDGSLPQADIGHSGKVINLLPGEEVVAPDQSRPNEKFDPFVLAILKQIGTALELPMEVLMKSFNSSYSAARAALLDAWRVFRKRRDFMATYFCQPVYETWLEYAVASGRIVAPGFFSDPAIRAAWCKAVWVGDGPGAIDPLKEVQAAEKRVHNGISTLDHESVMFDGVDFETKHRQRTKEQRMRKEAGLLSDAGGSREIVSEKDEE